MDDWEAKYAAQQSAGAARAPSPGAGNISESILNKANSSLQGPRQGFADKFVNNTAEISIMLSNIHQEVHAFMDRMGIYPEATPTDKARMAGERSTPSGPLAHHDEQLIELIYRTRELHILLQQIFNRF